MHFAKMKHFALITHVKVLLYPVQDDDLADQAVFGAVGHSFFVRTWPLKLLYRKLFISIKN